MEGGRLLNGTVSWVGTLYLLSIFYLTCQPTFSLTINLREKGEEGLIQDAVLDKLGAHYGTRLDCGTDVV